ncbi:hypothetical protein K502DRAFT_332308 [Neoconidiobolus thromboides FSU 785]|nr:hypothetical protein K502DRAFT_332308 [Neoconidiobolus thromboides FSU 785]
MENISDDTITIEKKEIEQKVENEHQLNENLNEGKISDQQKDKATVEKGLTEDSLIVNNSGDSDKAQQQAIDTQIGVTPLLPVETSTKTISLSVEENKVIPVDEENRNLAAKKDEINTTILEAFQELHQQTEIKNQLDLLSSQFLHAINNGYIENDEVIEKGEGTQEENKSDDEMEEGSMGYQEGKDEGKMSAIEKEYEKQLSIGKRRGKLMEEDSLKEILSKLEEKDCRTYEEMNELLKIDINTLKGYFDNDKIKLDDGVYKSNVGSVKKKKMVWDVNEILPKIDSANCKSFKELAEATKVPKATLYNWFYKGLIVKKSGALRSKGDEDEQKELDNKDNKENSEEGEVNKDDDNGQKVYRLREKVKGKREESPLIKRDMLEIYSLIEKNACKTFQKLSQATQVPLGTLYDWYCKGRIVKVEGVYKPAINFEELSKDLKVKRDILKIFGIINSHDCSTFEQLSELTEVPKSTLRNWYNRGKLHKVGEFYKPILDDLDYGQPYVTRPKRDVTHAFAKVGGNVCKSLDELSIASNVPKKTLYNWVRQEKIIKVNGYFQPGVNIVSEEEQNFLKLKEKVFNIFNNLDTSECRTFTELAKVAKVSKTALHTWFHKGLIEKRDGQFQLVVDTNFIDSCKSRTWLIEDNNKEMGDDDEINKNEEMERNELVFNEEDTNELVNKIENTLKGLAENNNDNEEQRIHDDTNAILLNIINNHNNHDSLSEMESNNVNNQLENHTQNDNEEVKKLSQEDDKDDKLNEEAQSNNKISEISEME